MAYPYLVSPYISFVAYILVISVSVDKGGGKEEIEIKPISI